MEIKVNISPEQIYCSDILDLDKIALALDLLGDIHDDDLIQEVISYISNCRNSPIRSDVFESIRIGKAAQR